MAAAEDTSKAIEAAVQAAVAEQTQCGGAALNIAVQNLLAAQAAFELHETTEDHIS